MTKSKLKQIESALKKAIPEGKALDLSEDTFLTGALDGSDKIYGFVNEKGEIKVESRCSLEPYPISELDKGDVDYIFGLSVPNILRKIKANEYEIVSPEDL